MKKAGKGCGSMVKKENFVRRWLTVITWVGMGGYYTASLPSHYTASVLDAHGHEEFRGPQEAVKIDGI